MNEVVKKEETALISSEDMDLIRQYDELNKRYKVWVDSHKEMFENFLDEHDLQSYEQDGVRIYKTKPYKKKQVDAKAMKDDGIYDLYTNDIWVKGSIRVQVEYEDED